MSIVDSVSDTQKALERRFANAKRRGRIKRSLPFQPVCTPVNKRQNLYEMFCVTSRGQRLHGLRPEQFRPVITGSTPMRLVRWDVNKRRFVSARAA